MIIYDFSNIKTITLDGLTYLDANGRCQFMSFYECRANWIKHVNDSDDFITLEGEPYKNIAEKDTNCVGQRDWYFENPYIEFFTEPTIRVEIKAIRKWWDFLNEDWKDRYYKRFLHTNFKINDCGWSTFDLG